MTLLLSVTPQVNYLRWMAPNRFFQIILYVSLIAFSSGCGSLHIEKRVHRKGFHISWNKRQLSKNNEEPEKNFDKVIVKSHSSFESNTRANENIFYEEENTAEVFSNKEFEEQQSQDAIITTAFKAEEPETAPLVKASNYRIETSKNPIYKEVNKLSLWGFILTMTIIGALVGVPLAFVGFEQIKKDPQRYKSYWLAYIPIILLDAGLAFYFGAFMLMFFLASGYGYAVTILQVLSAALLLTAVVFLSIYIDRSLKKLGVKKFKTKKERPKNRKGGWLIGLGAFLLTIAVTLFFTPLGNFVFMLGTFNALMIYLVVALIGIGLLVWGIIKKRRSA